MAWKLLLPWLDGLVEGGFEVHLACSRTKYFEQLEKHGLILHEVKLRRRLNPLLHIWPLWQLYRLIRKERFRVVNTHSPIAAAVGRSAAWLARTAVVVYTVHGFYFHDRMPAWKRRGYIAVERLLGKTTNSFMFVSDEDRRAALKERIAKPTAKTTTIYNGVDLESYPAKDKAPPLSRHLRYQLEIPSDATVVGIVGRVVREKGYLEFAEMAKLVSAGRDSVCFLVVGDALPSDRDGVVAELHSRVDAAGLAGRFRFTGFTERVADYLQIMDIFVLPSYREGFPRSVLEAMSSGLPVVATDIRGCREAVSDGVTALLVPPEDATSLAAAVARLLDDPDMARRMGSAGRERAESLYSHKLAQHLFLKTIKESME
jgi:glycosyltransferase involved in cell wall biosynthesis